MRFTIALIAGKLCEVVLKILGKFLRVKGTRFPGDVALKICPDFLNRLAKPEWIVGVTGTDGKTTTCNLLIDSFEKCGYKVLCNRTGTNILPGVAVAFMDGVTLGNKCKYDVAVIEIDERSAVHIFPKMQPDYLVVTNLFRDSLKRNAHPEFIFNVIRDSMPKPGSRPGKDMTVICNGDDVISCRLGKGYPTVTFGIDRLPSDREESFNIMNDARICPECHHKMTYEFVRYHHIGRCYCENCGFKLPETDYQATRLDIENRIMTVKHQGEERQYRILSDSIFNIYNELTAITVLSETVKDPEKVKNVIDSMEITKDRFTERTVAGRKLVTCTAKDSNATACSIVFDYVRNEPGRKDVMLNIDEYFDNRGSYEILSWMYDCDFEFLNDDLIERIIIGGKRCRDVKFRLLLAGVPEEKLFICDKEEDVYKYLTYEEGKDIYLLHDMYFVSQDQAAGIVKNIEARLNGEAKEETNND